MAAALTTATRATASRPALPPPAPERGSWLARCRHSCWRAVADLFCPPQCQLCGVDLDESLELESRLQPAEAGTPTALLCGRCLPLLASSAVPVCPRCAGPVPRGAEDKPDCARCDTTQFHFESVAGLGVYRNELQAAVLKVKQAQHEPLALSLGALLAAEVAARWPEYRPDLVLPIPMYWARRWLRGHNAPEIIAESLANRLGAPVATDALVCRRSVERQSTLPPSERFRNVRGAFRVSRGYDLRGAGVLLVDDTLTTGATASEAARVLKQAGTAGVRVAVAARGIGVD